MAEKCVESLQPEIEREHIDVCPKVKVSCELGCGLIVCREDITQHLEVDCLEKELECPFAKYKCQMGLIKRKNMSKHLEEKRIEHLELKMNWNYMEESEIIAKQTEKISEQSMMIETMSQEIKSLNKKVQLLCCIPIKLEWRITKLPDIKSDIKKTFLVAGYHLKINLCRYSSFYIIIHPLTGWYSEEQKWPFKAKFITRLKSQLNPKDLKESESSVIVMEKKHFYSRSGRSSIIATFSEDDFLENHYFDGATDIEILAIFL